MVHSVYCAVREVGYLFVKDARKQQAPSKDKHTLAAALAIFTLM